MTAADVSALAEAAALGRSAVIVRRLDRLEPAIETGDGTAFAAASMIKVPIVAALAECFADGTLEPETRLTVRAEHLTENDAASPLRLGETVSLGEFGRLAIVRSDNVATNALIDLLRRDTITERMRAHGLAGTRVRRKLTGGDTPVDDPGATGRNTFPPSDAARLFAAIAAGTIPGVAWLFHLLAAQEWNDKLNAGLSPGDRFAHKTGDTSEASHDGGILDTAGGARYIVVVYTALPSSPASDARLGAFMQSLRPLLAR